MAKVSEAQKEKNAKQMNLYIAILFTVICAFIFAHTAYLMDMYSMSFGEAIMQSFSDIFEFKDFSIFPFTLNTLIGILASCILGIIFYLYLYTDYEMHRHYTTDEECGTAEFNDMGKDMDEFNKKYSEPFQKKEHDGESNMIMSQNVYISTKFWETKINSNVTIFGSAGTGKSFRIAKPNLLQATCSYVCTDPSGELLKSVGSFLRKQGYKIKIFNISDMLHSNCYNPFVYVRDEAGVMTLVKCLIKNTNAEKAKTGDPFWEKAEEALLSAIIYYLKDFVKDETQKNFASVMKFLRAGELDENNPNGRTKLDSLFEECPRKSMAWKNYRTFKLAPTKTRMSIMISLGVRLNPFNVEAVADLTRIDNLDLGNIGFEKTALFINTPQADQTYTFLASILYAQLFETLYHIAEHDLPKEADGRLPVHVRCLMDEIANIGVIPDFPSRMATMRKYNISATPIWQSLSQMKSRYEKDWEEMLSNSSTVILLGTNEETTAEYFSKMMGKRTIRQRNRSVSDGGKKSANKSYQQTARNLMDPSEIMQMNPSDCIVMVTGNKPIRDKKYDPFKHPHWNETKEIFDYKNYPIYNTRQNDERMMVIKQMALMEQINAANIITESRPVGSGGITSEKTDEKAYNSIKVASESQAKTLLAIQTKMVNKAAGDEADHPIIIVNEGPIPVRTLTYLASKTMSEFNKPCVIFANNVNRTNELYGIAAIDDAELIKKIDQLEMVKYPLREKEGFLEVKINRYEYERFKHELLNAA